MAEIDHVLRRFRSSLDLVYGDRIERVVFFGSRARGDAHAGSDYDIAVFLEGLHGRFGTEARTVAEIESTILLDTGLVINALLLPAGSSNDRTSLMGELRRDGRDL